MNALADYITQNFGLSAKVLPAGKGEILRLPLYLKGNFDFFRGKIGGKDLLWVKVREEGKATPDWLQKQREQLKNIFHIPVVFVFDHLDGWQRKRLIEKNLGFVQLYKQLYIPEMLIQLSDVLNRESPLQNLGETLGFPAQVAILYRLQKRSLGMLGYNEIAKILHYSSMTVTRLARELQSLDLIRIPAKAKSKFMGFPGKKEELWNKARPYLHSPIKEVWRSEKGLFRPGMLLAGDSALEEYTMLAGASEKTYAIGKKSFRSLQTSGKLPDLNKKYGSYKLEVWEYDPMLIADDGSKVDRLSLFLSMRDQQDERVQHALNELLNGIEW